MTSFAIGCTHFNHVNIIELANRPFDNVYQMNELMIENWNRVVKSDDIVYHLGDVAHWADIRHQRWFSKLNGQKVLILGNHDHDSYDTGTSLYELYREDVAEMTNYMDIRYKGKRFILFHYPMEDWNGRYRGSIHLHCHTHQSELKRPLLPYLSSSALTKEGEEGLVLPKSYPVGIRCNRL